MKRSRGVFLVLAALLSGCAVGPSYHSPTIAALGVPDQYSELAGAARTSTTKSTEGAASDAAAAVAPAGGQIAKGETDAVRLASWWAQFHDPVLDRLVEKAVASNLDLRQAEARLRQAREGVVQAQSSFFPSVTGGGNAVRNFNQISGFNQGTGNGTRYTLSLDASWQTGLFGGTYRSYQAARADEQSSRYSLAAVQTSIVSELVRDYVQLRLQQQQLDIARKSAANQRDNRAIAGWRVEAGLASSLDEQQAEAQLAQTEATIPAIEAQIRTLLHQIAVLLGEAPGAATAALEQPEAIPSPPAEVMVGVPADTLRQRPDVRVAERNLAAATARVGVAESQLFPALTLSGTLGTAATAPAQLFNVVTGSLLAGLNQTLFRGGALLSQLRSQKAAVDGALAAYRAAVLQALQDVEDALTANRSADARAGQLAIAAQAANNSAVLARMQYQSGLTDFQTLLQAEQTLLSANNALASVTADRSLAVVQLYNAMGGGWQNVDGTEG